MSTSVIGKEHDPGPASRLPSDPTLADVLQQLDRCPDLSPRQRADLRSAVISVGRVLDLPLAGTPARLDLLRPQLSQVLPAAHGLTRQSWNTVRSRFGKALRQSGLQVLPGRDRSPLDTSWAEMRAKLKRRTHWTCLFRFMHYCSAHSIAPEVVDDAVLAAFRRALLEGSLVRKPMIVAQRTVACWNQAVAEVPGWPQARLTVQDLRDRYTQPLNRFPPSLQAEIEAYLARLAGGDPLEELPFRPANPATIDTRRYMLRQLASALVLQGRDPASIVALADLVTREAARSAMLFFLARSGNQPTTQTGSLAGLLLSVGRHWVKVGPQQETYLKSLARRCRPPQRGMTEKNRTTLRQFDDPDVVDRLLELPRQIHAELRRRKNLSRAQARRLALALAVQLLLDTSIRRQNLTRLELGRHLVRVGTGRKAGWHLYLPAEDVKNDQAMEFPLRRDTAGLLEFYLEKVRPGLVVPGSTRLFAGRDRKCRNADAFSTQLGVFLRREIGVRLSTHQFRHLAGFLYLSKVPGGHEVLRALLGHKRLATTVQFYAGMETVAAARAYDAAVLGGGRAAA